MLPEKKINPGEKKLSLPMLETPITVRIKFCKLGNLQFVSHLDLQRTFHRVLVRANIPMWYTQGFNPHAKLVFGLPLPVGTESMCEMADLKIERKISLEDIKKQLNEQLTDEMYILEAYYPTSKFADIAYADYTITIKAPGISESSALAATSIFVSPVMMMKKSKSGEKEVDITQYIKKLEFESGEAILKAKAILTAGSTENLNPEYIVNALRSSPELNLNSSEMSYRILRNKVYDRFMMEFK